MKNRKEKPFGCLYCTKSCASSGGLTKHIESKHQGESAVRGLGHNFARRAATGPSSQHPNRNFRRNRRRVLNEPLDLETVKDDDDRLIIDDDLNAIGGGGSLDGDAIEKDFRDSGSEGEARRRGVDGGLEGGIDDNGVFWDGVRNDNALEDPMDEDGDGMDDNRASGDSPDVYVFADVRNDADGAGVDDDGRSDDEGSLGRDLIEDEDALGGGDNEDELPWNGIDDDRRSWSRVNNDNASLNSVDGDNTHGEGRGYDGAPALRGVVISTMVHSGTMPTKLEGLKVK